MYVNLTGVVKMKMLFLAITMLFVVNANATVTNIPTTMAVTEVNFIDGVGTGGSNAYTMQFYSLGACEAAKLIVLAEEYPNISIASTPKRVRVTRTANCFPAY
jgi:hypothetical protein